MHRPGDALYALLSPPVFFSSRPARWFAPVGSDWPEAISRSSSRPRASPISAHLPRRDLKSLHNRIVPY